MVEDIDDATLLALDIDAIAAASVHAMEPLILQGSERVSAAPAWEARALELLQLHWGHTVLRDKQREAIEAALCGNDSVVILATGRGKSICYQLVPLITGRPAIVVSPLISLMTDQVAALSTRGVRAVLLGSAQLDPLAEQRAAAGEYDLVYMTPEKLQSFDTGKLQRARGLSLLAVDEAHCVCEWGFDFRPSYAAVGAARPRGVPLMALTATAPPPIRAQMCSSLRLAPGSPRRTHPTLYRPTPRPSPYPHIPYPSPTPSTPCPAVHPALCSTPRPNSTPTQARPRSRAI